MNSILRKVIDIREGEEGRALIMFSYIFLIIASYLILKPMTRSLFLKNLGPAQLPFVYMLVALVVGVVAVFYARVAARARLDRLINGTTLFLISNLFLFWWLLRIEVRSAWLYYGLYIWVSIYGVLTTSQFWLLANYVFNPREAKRIFPLLAAGAILGGISGGYFTRALVKQIGGTTNLAFFCIGFLGTTILLMNLAWRRRDQSQEAPKRLPLEADEGRAVQIVREVFALIRNSRHLALLMGVVAMTVMVSQIADFQFSTYASEEIAGTDDLTGFLGFWLSNLSVISLFFQVLFAGAIIRRFGVGISVLFLPVAMLATSLWVLFGYGLISILAIKISDGAFRYSINKAGLELLFLPIPQEVKNKTKAFIDMFADRLARGLSGFLLLIFYTWLGLSVAQISLVSVALVGIWLVVVLGIRREYVDSFRRALAKRRIDADALTVSIKDEATVKTLVATLASRNDGQVVYALNLLESVEGVELAPHLRPLLQHSAPEVRARTLEVLRQRGESALLSDVEPLLRDPDEKVRQQAVHYHCHFAKEPPAEMLGRWIEQPDIGLQGAALHCIAEKPDLAEAMLTRDRIESFLKQGPEAQSYVAAALGVATGTKYHPILLQLMEATDPQVRMEAMASAALTRSRQFVPALMRHLGDRIDRRAAREALATYGESIVGTLSDYLNDETEPVAIRREIPRVLSRIGTQRCVDVLLDCLPQSDEMVRYRVIKALNKLRSGRSDLIFDQRVDQALVHEAQRYYQLLATLHGANGSDTRPADTPDVLQQALRERLDDHLERIFRLLGLRYPPRDIHNAFAATTSSNRAIRANAVEFLDNLLSKNHKRVLLPIVEELPVDQVLRHASELLDVQVSDQREALRSLIADNDPWLRACALYEIGVRKVTELQPSVDQARTDIHPLVRETAEMVLRHYF
jgi:AAA family ATP:ADP antiporter